MSARGAEPATRPASAGALAAPFRWRRQGELAWIELDLPGARGAFSTRAGGVSEGPYRALNLGILTADRPERVVHNRERLASALGREPQGFAIGMQVHGADVQVHRGPPAGMAFAHPGASLERVDGQVAADPGVTPLVLAADCVPLVLATPGAVAAVHCGWRGTTAGVVARAVSSLCDAAGARLASVVAALGPSIGPCCYEVGEELAEEFAARGHVEALSDGRLDLALVVRRELVAAGVEPASIASTGLCTSCRADLFFSHRRDHGVTGRQAAIVWRVSEASDGGRKP